MKHLQLLACALLWAGATTAQQTATMGDYDSISIDKFGVLKANFNGSLERLGNGVQITLKSSKEGVKPLPISAGNMNFTWPDGASTPTAIVMEGGVKIQHPQGTVSAQRAEWNFDKNTLEFSGNAAMSSEMFKELKSEKMILNLSTGEFEASGAGSLSEIQIGAAAPGGKGGGASSPDLLNASDVSDWEGLLKTLKEQGAAAGNSPGKQILAQLDAQTRSVLTNTPPADLAKDPTLLVKQFNNVLRQPKLYSAEAWNGVGIGEEAEKLLAKKERTGNEQIRLNRLLLKAAYPEHIK